jgi:hypothetical protein
MTARKRHGIGRHCPGKAIRNSRSACYAACSLRRLSPAHTSRPGNAPVCLACSKAECRRRGCGLTQSRRRSWPSRWRRRQAGSAAEHQDQGSRAVRLVHEVFTMGLGMFFSAQSRKTSNYARAVDPSMPMCVWPLNLPSKRGSSPLTTSAGPTLRVGLAFMAATAA